MDVAKYGKSTSMRIEASEDDTLVQSEQVVDAWMFRSQCSW